MTTQFTTSEMESNLGHQIREARLRKNMTMATLAHEAGISVQALRSLEIGNGARVETLVRVARALGRSSWLDSFNPPVSISPMQMLESKSVRQRASKSARHS